MRDINQVLREKIAEYNKVLREVQALRVVAPLLIEPADQPNQEKPIVTELP